MSIELKQGDALAVLKTMESESVHCAITSPPYWGLRDYGTATWQGGDAGCDHSPARKNGKASSTLTGGQSGNSHEQEPYIGQCGKCGAVRIDAQIGLEPTPELYVEHIVAVMREVWRVLRDDGTLWLNLGDSYATGTTASRQEGTLNLGDGTNTARKINRIGTPVGVKTKDLVGIPWRVAFALQADGWYLRSDIIWSKPNPMPESVTDRPTKAHEYVFLLAKSARYYYDAEAIKEPLAESTMPRVMRGVSESHKNIDGAPGQTPHSMSRPRKHGEGYDAIDPNGRNRRTVWTVPTNPYSGAHFATFPPKLIEPMILAACPVGGTVLDMFCGTATVGAVCVQHNRNFIGIELNPKYIELARERIAKAQARDPRYLRECGMSLSEIAKTLKVTVPEVARQLK